jgi:hypothetical protein
MDYQHFQLLLNNGRLDIKLDEVYKKLKLGSQSTGVMLDVTAACTYCEVYEYNVITLNNKYTAICTATFKLLVLILYCFAVSRKIVNHYLTQPGLRSQTCVISALKLLFVHNIVEIKVKPTLLINYHAIRTDCMVEWWNGGIAPRIINLGNRWR